MITALLIFSFLTMGISPACHFVSGEQGYIEICTDDDEVEQISLAAAGFSPNPRPAHDKTQSEQCLFCFSASNGKALNDAESVQFTPSVSNYLANGRGSFIPKSSARNAFDARGPPNTVV